MGNFEFSNPVKFHFGAGKLELVGKVAGEYGKKALIIASDSAKPTGLLKRVEQYLDEAKIEHVFFNQFMQNPLSTLVMDGAKLANEEKCDMVIGLGGGSAMDMAKGIAFCAVNPDSIWDYVYGKRATGALPILLVPTTAGTGSEGNRTAVFNNPDTNDKKGLVNPLIYPKVSIIDPELMTTLPKRVVAGPGADVLFHAIESYISKNSHPISEMLSLQAIELIAQYLPIVYEDVKNIEAWEKVTLASTLAGMAIDCAGTTLPHALQHPMGGLLNVIHSEGLAALYMSFMEYTYPAAPEKFANIAKAMGTSIDHLSTIEAAACSLDAVKKLLTTVNMMPTLSELGVKEEHLDWLTNNALTTMKVVLSNNPKVPTGEEIKEIYRKCL